jgi:hypothetical protein
LNYIRITIIYWWIFIIVNLRQKHTYSNCFRCWSFYNKNCCQQLSFRSKVALATTLIEAGVVLNPSSIAQSHFL